jgi:hypothetical protein
MITMLNKLGIEGKHLNTIKSIDDKSTANTFNDENRKLFF